MPDIIITPRRSGGNPTIQFSGSASSSINLEVLPEGQISFAGKSGSLFSITDNLEGSLMAVGDASGLPILEVFSDDRVIMGQFNKNTLVVSASSVGIGKVPNQTYKLDISGSLNVSDTIYGTFAGSISTASYAYTASYLLGSISTAVSASFATTASYARTASYVVQAISASYASNVPLTASYALTAQTASYVVQAISASYASNVPNTASWSVSASFARTASYVMPLVQSVIVSGSLLVSGSTNFSGSVSFNNNAGDTVFSSIGDVFELTGSMQVSGSIVLTGSMYVSGSVTSSLLGTASYATNALSSSYALSASYATTALSSSNSRTASYLDQTATASYALLALTASFAQNFNPTATASFAVTASALMPNINVNFNQITASAIQVTTLKVVTITSSIDYASGSNVFGTKLSDTHTFTGSVLITGSMSIDGQITGTSSFAQTASYAINGGTRLITGSSYNITSSWAEAARTASYINDLNQNAKISGSFTITGSLNVSGALNFNGDSGSVLFSSNADTFEFSGSMLVTGSIILTGSMNVNGDITSSLFGTASYASRGMSSSYAISSSYAVSSSYGVSSSYAVTSSYASTANALVSGINVNVGQITASSIQVTNLNVVTITSSIDYASGSNIFGNSISNTHQFTGSVKMTGSLTVDGPIVGTSSWAQNATLFASRSVETFATTGSNVFVGNQTITGSFSVSGSTLQAGNNILLGTTTLSGSINISGSTYQVGNTTMSGSVNISGSTIQTGNNTLIGNTTLSGSIQMSGSTTQVGNIRLLGNTTISGSLIISGAFGTPTPSVKIYGDVEQNGYIKFMPVTTNVDTTISASYVYVSGSTNDLYFAQNNNGITNNTRLRWLEGTLYTGILKGGVITSTPGSTTFNISSGSGLIVKMNANTSSEPYPTSKYINWGNYLNQPIINSGSGKITYVGIDENGAVVQQLESWGSTNIDQFDDQIQLGVVLHLSGSVSNGVFNSPQTSYGANQKSDDFFRSFGPLKISGHTLQTSGSTLGLRKAGGTAYKDGANYSINPNHPSTVVENAVNVSKIYRYYVSGSTAIIDTGVANVGFAGIDPNNYNNNGVLTPVPSNDFSIQRVYWIPNSPTNAFIVYYGTATYPNLLTAINAKDSEVFTEAPNTATNGIFLGYVIVKDATTNLANASDCTIIQGGLFRSVGGVGSSGTSTTVVNLANLSDVSISAPTSGQALVYDGTALKWKNLSGITASLYGNASTSTTASYAFTASYLLGAATASYATTASYSDFSTTASFAQNFNPLATASYALLALTASNVSYSNVSGINSTSTFAGTSSYSTIADGLVSGINVNLGQITASSIQVTNLNVITVTSSLIYASGSNVFGNKSTDSHQFTGSVSITGSLTVNGQITGTASFATTFADSGSFAGRTTDLETASGSFSTRVTNLVTDSASFSTRVSNLVIDSGSFSTRITNLVTDSSSFSLRITNDSSSFSSRISDLVTDSSSFSTRVSNLVTDSSSFSTRISNLVTDSSSFSTRVTNLVTDSSSFSTRVTDLKTDSSSFSYRLTNFTGSVSGTASYAITASNVAYSNVSGITTTSNFAGTSSFATIANSLVAGINVNVSQITASAIQVTNLNVITITSSIDYASGSNIFGTKSTDTQQFTGSVSITGSLSLTGTIYTTGRVLGAVIKTTNYTVTTMDNIVVCNHATTPFTVTLIDATANTGREFVIKNKGAAGVTIDATSLGLLDGSNTYLLNQYESIKVVSDGVTWNIL